MAMRHRGSARLFRSIRQKDLVVIKLMRVGKSKAFTEGGNFFSDRVIIVIIDDFCRRA
jgi:hypothetical protein